MVSCRIGNWAGSPVRHVVNAASVLPPVRGIRGSVLEQEPQGDMLRYLRDMEELFAAAVPRGAAMLEGFFTAVETGKPLLEAMMLDYSGNEVDDIGIH